MDDTIFRETRPWEQPFWKPARGKGAVLFYLVLIHLLAIVGLILFPLPSPEILGVALVIAALGGFGITVCYHRLLAHRTLKLNKFVENFLIFWAMFNSGGSPASWVAYHRHHHSHTDTAGRHLQPKARWLLVGPLEVALSIRSGRRSEVVSGIEPWDV